MTTEGMMKLLMDTELDNGMKGLYSILVFCCEGRADFATLKQFTRESPTAINIQLKHLVRKNYIRREGEEWACD